MPKRDKGQTNENSGFDLQSFLQGRRNEIIESVTKRVDLEIQKDFAQITDFYKSRMSVDRYELTHELPRKTMWRLLAKYDLPTRPLDNDQYEDLERRTRRQRKELFACKSNCLASRIVNEIIDDG